MLVGQIVLLSLRDKRDKEQNWKSNLYLIKYRNVHKTPEYNPNSLLLQMKQNKATCTKTGTEKSNMT